MAMISIEPFSTISGEPVLPLSDSDQDRPPSNKDQKSRTRILNPLAADLKNLFLIWTWRRKPSGGGGSGFSAIPKFLLSFIASVGCAFSAIRKALLSLIPSGGGGGGDGGISAIPKVFIFFIAIFMLWMVIPSSNSSSILHQVPEGHVGVYWRGGALLKTVNDPGFHLKLPFVTHYEPVQVTLQTDQVRDISCGTKGGVMINFEKIEVVNRLHKEYVHDTLLKYGKQYDKIWIHDKIHHEINQFCNSHSLQQVYIDVFDQVWILKKTYSLENILGASNFALHYKKSSKRY